MVTTQRMLETSFPVMHALYCESLTAEIFADQPAEFHIVVDDKHPIHD